ncbi:MAG: hypothetical protein AMXMBFR23_02090 [Chloroflexota bacterium]
MRICGHMQILSVPGRLGKRCVQTVRSRMRALQSRVACCKAQRLPAFGERLSVDEIVAALAHIRSLWGDDERAHQEALP